MKITIMDYKNSKKEVDVGELKDIRKMIVRVVTGDEILMVEYNNNETKVFDSSDDRRKNFYDGEYILFNRDIEPEINELENPDWLNRTNYSYLYDFGDTSEADNDWGIADIIGW